ncbi:hypothetical protein EPN83_00970 [Patescibacteria group bacterium]|nr:MAG: hypothetical protein EPN83_00970 [Patescibacteria group bacterium]
MSTSQTEKPEAVVDTESPPYHLKRILKLCEELRSRIPRSLNLADEVNKTLKSIEAEVHQCEAELDFNAREELQAFLWRVEDLVNTTPTAQLREQLQGLRYRVECNPRTPLDELPLF